MSTAIDVTARIIARSQRRAFPIRETVALCPDPDRTFGLVVLKVVSEDQVQALAFGDMTRAPRIITRWNPLGRESADLEPFAQALNDYVITMLNANERMRKVYDAVNLESVGRFDADAPVARFDADGFAHHQRAARRGLCDDAGALDHFREGFRRAIHNRNFQVIDVDVGVIHPAATQGREQMLDRRKHDARAHQRCGIAAMRDRFNRGRNFKAPQVSAAKNVPGIRWRGQQTHLHRNRGVQSDAVRFDFAGQGCLFQVYE